MNIDPNIKILVRHILIVYTKKNIITYKMLIECLYVFIVNNI